MSAPRVPVKQGANLNDRRVEQEKKLAEARRGKRLVVSDTKRKMGLAALAPPLKATPGVVQRDETTKTTLRVFAKSDFKHDFGENVLSRDLMSKADRERFLEMIQRFSVRQRAFLMDRFEKTFPTKQDKTANLFLLYKDEIAAALYPEPEGDNVAEFIAEVDILEAMGVNYTDLKNKFKSHFLGPRNPKDPEPRALYPSSTEILVKAEGLFSRNYGVGAQMYKNSDGTTRNLASLFQDVTGGVKTKFAILVDASLGMSVTSIGDGSLRPPPKVPKGEKCSFVILQNIESDADSATGAGAFKIIEGPNSMDVSLLRDITTSTSLYPIWNQNPEEPKETENLFSKVQIILNRVKGDDIEASILVGDESHNIPDVGTTSNVKNASLNALLAKFNNDFLTSTKQVVTEADARKPFLYPLLKRMGDWCQALSLLDRIRTYTPLDPKTKKPTGDATKTIQDLITEGYEVGLVTNDRILLAYGLFLGVNVYFTTASDLNCLLYFKNMDDVASTRDVEGIANRNFETSKAMIAELGNTLGIPGADIGAMIQYCIDQYSFVEPGTAEYNKFREEILETVGRNLIGDDANPKAPNNELLEGIAKAFEAKVILSNIGELRTNFQELKDEFEKNLAVFNTAAPAVGPDPAKAAAAFAAYIKTKFDASVNLVNIANRIKTDFEYNDQVLTRLKSGKMSGTFESNLNVFVDLAVQMTRGGRITGAFIMVRAKNLLLTIEDDIEQILQKGILNKDQLMEYIPKVPDVAPVPPGVASRAGPRPNERDIENFTALYDAFKPITQGVLKNADKVMAGGSQTGGEGNEALDQFLQREVFPYKTEEEEEDLETTLANLKQQVKAAPEDSSDRNKARRALKLIESLPVANVGSYYRDEKNHPYSVIDRYILTKEDLVELAAAFATAVEAVKQGIVAWEGVFFQWRLALLYHDILYQRLESLVDHSTDDKSRAAQDLENSELTEEAGDELKLISAEAIVLIRFVYRAAADTLDEDFITAFIKSTLSGDSDAIDYILNIGRADEERGGFVIVDAPAKSLGVKVASILVNVRNAIFAKYDPKIVNEEYEFSDPLEAEPLTEEAEIVIHSESVKTVLESKGTILDDISGDPPLYVPIPEDEDSEDEAPGAVGIPAAVGAPGADEDLVEGEPPAAVGASRLQLPGGMQSNASGSASGGTRRRLYAGLRKRSGTGTTPGV